MLVGEDDRDYIRGFESGVVYDGLQDSGIRGHGVLVVYGAPVNGKHGPAENKVPRINRPQQTDVYINAKRDCVSLLAKHHRQHFDNEHGDDDLIKLQVDNDATEQLDQPNF